MTIRNFQPDDADAVNAIALAAFQEYEGQYDDWAAFLRNVGAMSTLSNAADLIVALTDGRIAGAVGYVGPDRPKPSQFDPSWALIRMLVVDPAARGRGLGRALTLECIRRAERDQAEIISLHTSPFMTIARDMYLRLGFEAIKAGPQVLGAPTTVYVKQLAVPGPRPLLKSPPSSAPFA